MMEATLIIISVSNLFLEPTSANQQGKRFLLKETKGMFMGIDSHLVIHLLQDQGAN